MSLVPRNRRSTLWRFLLAAVLIIFATAATTAVAGLLQFKQLAADLNVSPSIVRADVNVPQPGNPQTILVIGSDHRIGEPFSVAHTDTMLLVRLNGASQTINVLSIPRDLQVTIPGFGVAKLNAAYADGGPNLLIKTLRTNVFPDLHVNHLVDVNFGGFQALVNAIGCVYADVDHRYYNNTLYTGYSSIDIQPGYQKLCGADALAFVRFRHTDSDLVRNARQQDFIRWAKDQYGVSSIVTNKDQLLRIFGAHTQTDANLHTLDGLVNLFNLVAFSAGHRIRQVRFPAQLQPCTVQSCFVTASPSAEATTFRTFMNPTSDGSAAARKSSGGGRRKKSGTKLSAAGLIADTADGKAQAAALSGAGLPVYYPKLIVGGSNYCSSLTSLCPLEAASPGSYPRAYRLRDRRGHPYPAYRMTLVVNSLLGQYFGVQGTTWQNPPLIAGAPLESRVVNGKKLDIYEQGGSITDVAWHTRQAVYWVSNTLTTDIPNREMINIAASLSR